jgi:hypothetical protein
MIEDRAKRKEGKEEEEGRKQGRGQRNARLKTRQCKRKVSKDKARTKQDKGGRA